MHRLTSRARRTGSFVVRAAIVLALTGAASIALAGKPGGQPPQSHAFGKSLSEWFTLYWEWSLWAQVGVEKPDHVGRVKFLPLPNGEYIGGSGTVDDPAFYQGHLDLTLAPGTPFVLPVVALMGWSYDPASGLPDDPPMDASGFHYSVLVDGRPVQAGYVAPVDFDEPIPLGPASYPGQATIFAQGYVFVHGPLSVGTHTIELESGLAYSPTADYSFGAEYSNTWTITVGPHLASGKAD